MQAERMTMVACLAVLLSTTAALASHNRLLLQQLDLDSDRLDAVPERCLGAGLSMQTACSEEIDDGVYPRVLPLFIQLLQRSGTCSSNSGLKAVALMLVQLLRALVWKIPPN